MAYIFKRYEEISGQMINYSKSSVIFGMKIPEAKRRRLQRILGIVNVGGGGKYLGLPEQFGRKKVEMFEYIVKRVKERTEGWSTKFLSPAGKEILIKSIAMALPVYSMNCFMLPHTICDEIQSVLTTFWWGKEKGKRKIPWVAWERMTLPKKEGGLGFKDLHNFNRALLAKQAWRIMTNPHSLLARLYKGMYHPHHSFLQAGTGNRVSFGWRSIQQGKELLQQGLRVRIGNGQNTRIWSDPWLPTLPPRPASGPILDVNMTVSDLWKEGRREWDPVVFEGVLNPEDQQLASSLFLSKHSDKDSYEWAYTKNAKYSVKSGYWVATHVNIHEDEVIQPPQGSIDLKEKLWKLQITPKIRHFLWRGLSGALATATQLRTRTIPADPICQKCCQEEETVNHILFTCPFANAVWRHVYSLVGQIRFSYSLEDNLRRLLLRATHPSLNTSQRLAPFWIMWRLWKSRNDFLFQKIIRSPQIEANKGVHEANEWIEANSNDEATRIDQTSQNRVTDRGSQWQPPPSGWLKCNFDSGFMQGRTFTNTGWIIRDSDGKVILSGCAKLQSATTPLQAEALGFLHVLHVVWAHGMRQICFEGDNKELISIINKCEDHSSIGSLLYDIRHWMAKLPLSSLDHINRERNSAADKMAQHTLTISSLYHLYYVPPPCLIPHLYKPYTI
ncbi:Ribonuclease H domain [Arabidopsis thaliana x Arabidopsis arenosa]|uniref:Ribonuclease H domain n=1 Tax=Arabidopsis thaliana x Arabidopsis arenosa TaxID=1240361 RepID=A0A8T2ARE8_9BRAS|nr:Ribonuclease H domain [Arabidopsis thaliana x Arabidopsis arenosa]